MGSEFLERNKRKSALAALLLLFSGRGKYVATLFVAGLVSVPFLISGERLDKIMAFPSVAAAMRAVGLGGADAQPGNAAAMMAAAGREAGGKEASFWEKYLRAVNAPLPPAGATSTMAMLRGGGDVFGPPVLKDKDDGKPVRPDKVKGAVNAEERRAGDTGDSVNLAGLVGSAGGGGGDGIYGNLMGENLGDRQGAGAGPYAGRDVLTGPGTASKASGMYSHVLDQSAEKVPVPGSPVKTKSRMGRVSNFAWKNMNTKTSKSRALGHLVKDNKRPMFQLSQAFTTGTMAYDSSTPEYEQSYSGATYDGNDVDADFLQGDAIVPATPNASFTGMLGGVDQLQQQAELCSEASGKEGKQVGDLVSLMTKKSAEIDPNNPPSCCDSGVGHWNDTLQKLHDYCIAYTTTTATLDAACQTLSAVIICQGYLDMHINPCSWLHCLFAWLLMFIVGSFLGVVGLLAVFSTMCGWNLFGSSVTNFVDGCMKWITGSGDTPAPPTLPPAP